MGRGSVRSLLAHSDAEGLSSPVGVYMLMQVQHREWMLLLTEVRKAIEELLANEG